MIFVVMNVVNTDYYSTIERFHSRGQQPCKFIGTKESFYIRKEINSTGLVWDTNMVAVSLFWDTNMAAVTSCENTLFHYFISRNKVKRMHKIYDRNTLYCPGLTGLQQSEYG